MKPEFLRQEADFAHHRFRRSVSSPSMRIRMAVPSQNITRFGFIVPKKVFANATDRNLIRRRLKSCASKNIEHVKPSDILLLPQKGSLRLTFRELETEFIANLKRLNLWRP